MARSSYIYLIFEAQDFSVCGVWTVKHEMMTAIEGREKDYYVFRVPDGAFNPKVKEIKLTEPKNEASV